MSTIIPFDFEQHAVRVLTREGEPWFVLADVCGVLSISNSRDASSRLDNDEKGVVITDTLGGPQEISIINESGLYNLIYTSRKPEAKRFRKWLTGGVLHAIRKTGSFGLASTPQD
ncbi:Bro-N domain-containing protein [Acetobacter orientalis]|uniref:BRO-N domain-containing protein n=1 Tax=Acetobacter orientalis TaxID=146474 RepID=UPI0039E9B136